MKRLKRLMRMIQKKVVSEKGYIELLRKSGMSIGDGCWIDKSAVFGSEPYLITIGNAVRITHGCNLITHDGGLWVLRHMNRVKESEVKVGRIFIGNNVNLGWNVTIMPDVTIGDNVVIGTGAVVTKDIPSNSVAAGIPAKVIETLDDYFSKIEKSTIPANHMSGNGKRDMILEYFGDGSSDLM